MRLFIAIEVPDEVSNYLKQIQKEINEKSTKPKTFHITLKFLGEITEKEYKNIKENLSKIKFKPFKLKLNKIGFFPDERKIKVIWVGFKDNRELIKLQNQVENATKEYKQDHPFSPHLTLARIKFVKDKRAFIESLRKIQIDDLEFEVHNFKLVKSDLKPEGPVYTVLDEF